MTDMTASPASPARKAKSLYEIDARTKRRNAAETRFRLYGLAAIGTGLAALVVLLITILGNGVPAFKQTYIALDVELLESKLDKNGNSDPDDLAKMGGQAMPGGLPGLGGPSLPPGLGGLPGLGGKKK